MGHKQNYANIGGMMYTRMIPQAERGAFIVTFNCVNCLEKGRYTQHRLPLEDDFGNKLGVKRFGDLKSITFVDPGTQVFGMWRCTVECNACKALQKGVHFGEAPSMEPYATTDLPRKWEENKETANA
jgi:hypothetical protein